jgi:hypothetical protein
VKPPPDLGEPLAQIPLQAPVGRLVIGLLHAEVVLGGDPVGMVV